MAPAPAHDVPADVIYLFIYLFNTEEQKNYDIPADVIYLFIYLFNTEVQKTARTVRVFVWCLDHLSLEASRVVGIPLLQINVAILSPDHSLLPPGHLCHRLHTYIIPTKNNGGTGIPEKAT